MVFKTVVVMKLIKTEKYGIIHAIAQCTICGWDSAINIGEKNRMQQLRNRIYAHVKKTKHLVNLETGNSTDYFINI